MIYRFTEVLNDLVNYFLLGDILLLEDWKQANHLSDDLAMEFTTTGTAAGGTISGLTANKTYYANAVDKTAPTVTLSPSSQSTYVAGGTVL